MTKIREILEKYRYNYDNEDDCGYWLVNDEDFDKLEKELKDLINMEWISVEDKLPKDNLKVLGFVSLSEDFCYIVIAVHQDKKWMEYNDTEYYRLRVTHWQPLPQPPKEDK